jgi:hypothetical protein
MGRSGYQDADDYDDADGALRIYGWRANVRRYILGRQGQAFLWELYQALEALPKHEIVTGALLDTSTGAVCALGAVAVHRKMSIPPEWCTSGAPDDEPCEYEFAEAMGPLFGIKDMLAREVMYENDEGDRWHWEDDGTVVRGGIRYGETRKYRTSDTPAERWQRMRRWVVSHLKGIP